MCGICGTTGPLILNVNDKTGSSSTGYVGGTNKSGGLVPQITKATQVVVYGPAETGPRQTVVDTANPSSWPAWITAINGKPIDNGKPGGTYQPQVLPDLVTFAKGPWWKLPLIVLGVVVVALAARKLAR